MPTGVDNLISIRFKYRSWIILVLFLCSITGSPRSVSARPDMVISDANVISSSPSSVYGWSHTGKHLLAYFENRTLTINHVISPQTVDTRLYDFAFNVTTIFDIFLFDNNTIFALLSNTTSAFFVSLSMNSNQIDIISSLSTTQALMGRIFPGTYPIAILSYTLDFVQYTTIMSPQEKIVTMNMNYIDGVYAGKDTASYPAVDTYYFLFNNDTYLPSLATEFSNILYQISLINGSVDISHVFEFDSHIQAVKLSLLNMTSFDVIGFRLLDSTKRVYDIKFNIGFSNITSITQQSKNLNASEILFLTTSLDGMGNGLIYGVYNQDLLKDEIYFLELYLTFSINQTLVTYRLPDVGLIEVWTFNALSFYMLCQKTQFEGFEYAIYSVSFKSPINSGFTYSTGLFITVVTVIIMVISLKALKYMIVHPLPLDEIRSKYFKKP